MTTAKGGLTIIKKAAEGSSGSIISDRDIALMADGETIVDGHHPKAKVVLVGAGGTISGEDVKRLSLSIVDGSVRQGKIEKAEKAETTADVPAAAPAAAPEKVTPAKPEKKEKPKSAPKAGKKKGK